MPEIVVITHQALIDQFTPEHQCRMGEGAIKQHRCSDITVIYWELKGMGNDIPEEPDGASDDAYTRILFEESRLSPESVGIADIVCVHACDQWSPTLLVRSMESRD